MSSALKQLFPRARTALLAQSSGFKRGFSVIPARLAENQAAPDASNFGAGAKPGQIATDLDQATGLERYELLERMAGREPWDLKPLEMTHMGTKKNPIVIKTVDPERFIGCTGYPADTHQVLWLTVTHEHDIDRCPECGCVYKYEYIGEGEPGGDHHH